MARPVILFLDGNVVIYRFEGTRELQLRAAGVIDALAHKHPGATLAVSRLTCLECLSKPMATGDAPLLARYESFFATTRMAELEASVVAHATRLRANQRLKTPDALVAASALALPPPVLFVTADAGFSRVPGLNIHLIAP